MWGGGENLKFDVILYICHVCISIECLVKIWTEEKLNSFIYRFDQTDFQPIETRFCGIFGVFIHYDSNDATIWTTKFWQDVPSIVIKDGKQFFYKTKLRCSIVSRNLCAFCMFPPLLENSWSDWAEILQESLLRCAANEDDILCNCMYK